MIKLNLGGGSHWHMDGWRNIDRHHIDPEKRADVLTTLRTLPDESVSLIYSRHFLEHLTYNDAALTLAEVYRVLRHYGTLRLGVPSFAGYTDIPELKRRIGWYWMVGEPERPDIEGHDHKSAWTDGLLAAYLMCSGFNKTHIHYMQAHASGILELAQPSHHEEPGRSLRGFVHNGDHMTIWVEAIK